MKIILGSGSRWRQIVLKEMNMDFEVISPDIDEKSIRFSDPKELTMALAKAKAEAVKKKISEQAILITSDQVVVCNGKILEKPENEQEAREFLEMYNNYPAETVSAILVTNLKTSKTSEGVDIAKIFFHTLLDADIDKLVKEKDTYTFAGGFGIDGMWAPYIKDIIGTRDSVMGLPKELTQKLIKEVE